MSIITLPSGPISTNCYIYILSPENVYIIDAPPESYSKIVSTLAAKNLKPSHLLLTHSHWDHIADSFHLKETYPDMVIAVHPNDQANLQNPGSDRLPCWIKITPFSPDVLIQEGDKIGPFEVIDTPGHTPGGVVFYDKERNVLFSGDTLFQGSFGNTSFSTGNPELMWKSLKKLATLPEKVVVYPGHGESTAIGKEKWLASAEEYFGN